MTPDLYLELICAAQRGEVPWRELRLRRRRLLDSLCGGCYLRSGVFGAVLRDPRAAASPRARWYAAVADGTVGLADAFAADRDEVELDLATLRALAPERRVPRVQRAVRTRYRSPLLVEALIEDARGELHHDARKSLGWLATARAVVARAEAEVDSHAGFAPLRDLLLRIAAHEGNALRVLGELRAADEAFDDLRRRIAAGEPPPTAISAEAASLEASLRYDQRRLIEAEALLERASLFFRRAGDSTGLARVLVQRGLIWYTDGKPNQAIPCFETAVAAVTADSQPLLALSARHNLVLCLCSLDRSADARRLLVETRPLYHRLGEPTTLNQLLWAEGKVAACSREDDDALARLRSARHGYRNQGLEFDAALVTLDLAEVHLRRGDTAEVKASTEPMARKFSERGVDREAARAVALFREAVLAEAVTLEIIARTRTALLRAHRPSAQPKKSHR